MTKTLDTTRLADIWENAALCTHCGYCLPTCPTYGVENNELHSPRGRVSVLLAVKAGDVTLPEAVEVLSHCLGCRACHTACPAGVKPGRLALAARSLVPARPSVFSEALHKITDSHYLTSLAAKSLGVYQGVGLQGLFRVGLGSWLLPVMQRLEALIPTPRPPVKPMPPRVSGPRVALLPGCMARMFLPNVKPASCNLITTLGYQVGVMEGFGCCGAPHREQGDREAFLRQVRLTIDALTPLGGIDSLDAVVCDSSVCAITLRTYGRALAGDARYAARAKSLAAKTRDLASFLAAAGAADKLALGDPGLGRLTFHDHCQAYHGQGAVAPPRQLLKALPGSSFVELPRPGRCCGAGGEYMLHHPQRSKAIRQGKLAALDQSRADTLVGGNPGCLMNIEAGVREQGMPVKVRHLAEVLWAAVEARKRP